MDIQAYISSGIIESYVLGMASEDEMQEIEKLSMQHPAIKQAIDTFELNLEKQALASTIAPSPELKQRIMKVLEQNGMNHVVSSAKVIPSQQNTTFHLASVPKNIKWLRSAIAASIILLLGSITLNFYFYSRYKKYNAQYTTLLEQQNTLLTKTESLQANYNLLKDTATLQVTMKSPTPGKTGAMATVLWNMKTKDVYLMVNHLPDHAQDKQYQLWAIVDGKPVDAGMIDMHEENALIKMHTIPNAQAFAITLEKKGGSPTPTMEQLYVMGKVQSI